MKINKLEIENVKRVKAVKIEPKADGLTIIGGDNNQGKTSVLDAIAWALGGENHRPSNPARSGSVTPPSISVTMSDGLLVERKGKNSDLTVTDTSGKHRGGQQILNDFVEQLAIDLPKFMNATEKEKSETLLNIIGVGPQLADLEKEEKETYAQRQSIGQIADRKKKYAEEQEYYPDVPKDIVSAAELIKQQQDILAHNGENQRKREKKNEIEMEVNRLTQQVNELENRLRRAKASLVHAQVDLETAEKSIAQLKDESTAELEASIANVDEINRKVRANLDKDKADDDAREYADQYTEMTNQLDDVRKRKRALLDNAKFPIKGLSVNEGRLTYNGQEWDNMSGSDQLIVATSIVRELNPKCGFVLLDKLEQLDRNTLQTFGEWLEENHLQAIATRVSSGDECQIIIQDGYAVRNTTIKEEQAPARSWTKGDF